MRKARLVGISGSIARFLCSLSCAWEMDFHGVCSVHGLGLEACLAAVQGASSMGGKLENRRVVSRERQKKRTERKWREKKINFDLGHSHEGD